jgi:maltose O-acetyltransferase
MFIRESFFLAVANHLPRLGVCDRFRYVLLRLAGVRVDGPCLIWGPVTIRPIGGAGNVRIGARTFLNSETRFGCPSSPVTIGSRVLVGPRVSFETVNHGLVHAEGGGRGTTTKPIVVEDEVWLGAGVIVLQGVTIGKGAVVTAGAVVTRDVEPYTVVGGVPARLIRAIGGASAEGAPAPAAR